MSEAIIEKIQKLLNLANHSNTPEQEAATAMRMAQALMARYNIEEEALAKKENRGQEIVKKYTEMHYDWYAPLFRAASMLYNCRMLFAGKAHLMIIGTTVNVEAGLLTFAYLVAQVERQYKISLPRGMSKSDRANFRRTFKYACSIRVSQRAEELTAELRTKDDVAVEATGSRALVVADMMDVQLKAVDDFIENTMKLGVRKSKPRSTGLGTSAGYEAGNRVNLQRPLTGGSKPNGVLK